MLRYFINFSFNLHTWSSDIWKWTRVRVFVTETIFGLIYTKKKLNSQSDKYMRESLFLTSSCCWWWRTSCCRIYQRFFGTVARFCPLLRPDPSSQSLRWSRARLTSPHTAAGNCRECRNPPDTLCLPRNRCGKSWTALSPECPALRWRPLPPQWGRKPLFWNIKEKENVS